MSATTVSRLSVLPHDLGAVSGTHYLMRSMIAAWESTSGKLNLWEQICCFHDLSPHIAAKDPPPAPGKVKEKDEASGFTLSSCDIPLEDC